jgi:hypothetical protein
MVQNINATTAITSFLRLILPTQGTDVELSVGLH